jgi:16S rRNA C1402 (ribose-2'-O) methylase RsmI
MAATLVIYEAPHRIIDCIEALAAVFEPGRQVVFAREITKLFEEIHRCRWERRWPGSRPTPTASAASSWCWSRGRGLADR